MIKVSAIIPVFNGSATIRQAIDSVLEQSSCGLELIVVDDGSTDSTPAIVESYGARVQQIRQANAGPAAARNAGVRSASGEYLAFLDADDRWLPGMLDRAIMMLDSDPDCVMAYSNLSMVDSEGRGLAAYLISGEYAHAPSMEEILARMWPIMPSAALIRRLAFDACRGFVEDFRGAGFEDAFLWLRLREQGHFRYIPEALAVWRFSWFPKPLKARPCRRDPETFARLVRQRYGVDPSPLVAARLRAPRSILGYAGLRALQQGDRQSARRAFARALKLDPFRARNVFRFARTFLPVRLAQSLSGRTGRTVQSETGESLR
ncbi:MAG: glycosyltransferase family 2 protein [Deltaproteobacteria bacterium]|nr:glycosyltransferase family 2 protein [Deltaproteobacteria bacterium]